MRQKRMNGDEPEATRPLHRSGAAGVLWNALTVGASKLVVLVTTVILARLLDPTDFGLLAIGLVAIGYLDFINDFGVSAAVIQRRDESGRSLDVAYWLNLGLGVLLTAVGILIAPFVADFFNEPRATDILRVLSLSFVIRSFGSIHEAKLRRDLKFSRRVLPELGKGIVKGAVSITMALTGFGVWSLVWGQLAGTAAAAVLYIVVMPWRPALVFDAHIARGILGFGSQITMVGLLGGLNKNVDYLVVGRSLGTRALGIYSLAFRMPQLLIESVVDVTGQVAFPLFARVQSDSRRLREGLRRMLRLTALGVVPLGLGLALISEPFVMLLYGERWEDAIPVMQLLALYMLVQSLTKNCGDVFKAMGRPGILNRLAILKLAVTVPALLAAVRHGIVWVAAAQLAAAFVLTLYRFWLAARVVGAPVRSVAGAVVPACRAGGVMVAVCLPAVLWLDVGPALELAIVVPMGVIAYTAAIFVFDRSLVSEIRDLLPRRTPDRVPQRRVSVARTESSR
jgi:lipopolysaccharide exporter